MLAFAANLSMLYGEHAFLDRFEAAAKAGFSGVECMFPYAWPANEVRDRLRANGLKQVLINSPAGDWGAGERGIAALPDRVAEFRSSFDVALWYAQTLECTRIHVMAGRVDQGANERTYIENLRWAAAEARRRGLVVLVETLNPIDMPGYLIGSVDAATRVIDAAGTGVAWQCDLYHLLMLGEDPVATYQRCRGYVGHVQVAGVPGRHEPDVGVLRALEAAGYSGWVGLEYRPRAGTAAGLAFLTEVAEATGAAPSTVC